MTMLNTVRKADSSFADQLSLELLKIELLRTKLLSVVFTVGFFVTLLTYVFVGADALPLLGAPTNQFIPLGATAILALMELGFQYRIKYWLQHQLLPPTWWWYSSAANEIIIPTVAMLLIGFGLNNPLDVLHTPVSSIYFAFIVMSILRLQSSHALFVGMLSTAAYVLVYVVLSMHGADHAVIASAHMMNNPVLHTQSAVIILIAGILAAFVARQLRSHFKSTMLAQEERNEVLKIFGRQTSPAVVDQLIEKKGEPESRRQDVSIMFVDVRGFTAFAEGREPETVVNYLNSLFSFMIHAVHQHDGMVHQLLGDGFMAVFGAPLQDKSHASKAVAAGVNILEELQRRIDNSELQETRIGIGVHSGQALVGMVGSNLHREYKITGDVVNVASRLEELNKQFNTCMLASESALVQAHAVDTTAFTLQEKVSIRGRTSAEVVRGIPATTKFAYSGT